MPGSRLSLGPATLRMFGQLRLQPLRQAAASYCQDRSCGDQARFFMGFRQIGCKGSASGQRKFPDKNEGGVPHPVHSIQFRSLYSAVGVSCSRYRGGIVPSSALRPFGHQPPCSIPSWRAASSAARSTPVCPPLMIFISPCGI